MLCGQVHIGTGAKAAWADFATIKTDPYEQWLRGPATDMCAKATPVTGGIDLAPLLETELGDRKSVVSVTSVAVRVCLVGPRIINKTYILYHVYYSCPPSLLIDLHHLIPYELYTF